MSSIFIGSLPEYRADRNGTTGILEVAAVRPLGWPLSVAGTSNTESDDMEGLADDLRSQHSPVGDCQRMFLEGDTQYRAPKCRSGTLGKVIVMAHIGAIWGGFAALLILPELQRPPHGDGTRAQASGARQQRLLFPNHRARRACPG